MGRRCGVRERFACAGKMVPGRAWLIAADPRGILVSRSHNGAVHSARATSKPGENMAVINGVCAIGLIVDPGEARGPIGSAALRGVFEKLLRPRGLMNRVTWYRSKISSLAFHLILSAASAYVSSRLACLERRMPASRAASSQVSQPTVRD